MEGLGGPTGWKAHEIEVVSAVPGFDVTGADLPLASTQVFALRVAENSAGISSLRTYVVFKPSDLRAGFVLTHGRGQVPDADWSSSSPLALLAE